MLRIIWKPWFDHSRNFANDGWLHTNSEQMKSTYNQQHLAVVARLVRNPRRSYKTFCKIYENLSKKYGIALLSIFLQFKIQRNYNHSVYVWVLIFVIYFSFNVQFYQLLKMINSKSATKIKMFTLSLRLRLPKELIRTESISAATYTRLNNVCMIQIFSGIVFSIHLIFKL